MSRNRVFRQTDALHQTVQGDLHIRYRARMERDSSSPTALIWVTGV